MASWHIAFFLLKLPAALALVVFLALMVSLALVAFVAFVAFDVEALVSLLRGFVLGLSGCGVLESC